MYGFRGSWSFRNTVTFRRRFSEWTNNRFPRETFPSRGSAAARELMANAQTNYALRAVSTEYPRKRLQYENNEMKNGTKWNRKKGEKRIFWMLKITLRRSTFCARAGGEQQTGSRIRREWWKRSERHVTAVKGYYFIGENKTEQKDIFEKK